MPKSAAPRRPQRPRKPAGAVVASAATNGQQAAPNLSNGEFQAGLNDIMKEYDARLGLMEGQIVFARAAVTSHRREVDRLRALLQSHGIDPDSEPVAAVAAVPDGTEDPE